jgi:aspartyl-tRNA(Asn)/glutamyl-tRNA(Gln) amidotransferase subunit C
MPNFDKNALHTLEKFSRIKCTPKEEPALIEGIRKILDYVKQLDEINTDNVPVCNFVLQDLQQNVLREDEIKDIMPTDTFLSNAPDQVAGMIKVPSILNKNN